MRPISAGRTACRLIAWLALLLGGMPVLAQDTADLLPVTDAYKLSADDSTPGTLKLHWTIAQDYYLYRGRMKFTAGDGVTLGTAQLPDGEKHHDEYLGDVETYHHGVDASIPYTVTANTRRLTLRVQYQGCHEVDPKICYPPHTEKLDLALPPGAVTDASAAPPGATANHPGAAFQPFGDRPAAAPGMDGPALPDEQAFKFEALAQDAHHLLLRWTMPKGYYLYRDQTSLKLAGGADLTLGKPEWPAGTVHHDDHYGSTTVYFSQVDVPVGVDGNTSGKRLVKLAATFQGCQDGGICYPPMTRTVDVAMTEDASAGPAVPPAASATDGGQRTMQVSLLTALLLALGGGLVLNLMPCVLPVLSIKAVGLLESGETPGHARKHALFYTAGVLCSFALIGVAIVALRSAGHALGWGAQLQQPLVVGMLACIMFAVGLSMSGVVQFGASLGNTGASLAGRSGPAGDFFTGVLAVLVASPCTAPFMGSALAYAFAAPMLIALVVFLALGLGLALPFLLIGFVPALARLLPRPGRWMETLKQVLAFPMYLTAVWLAWVLAQQRGADAIGLLLVAAVLLAMTLWWFERSRSRGAVSRALVLLLAAITLVPLYYLAHVKPPQKIESALSGTVVYTPQKLAELRKRGMPVFVDMTADWCVTCKANEHTVLDTDAFRRLLKRTGAVYMRGDWTDVDPTIEAFLQQYHSPGVPLYVVFPKNGGAGRQLSTVLTPSLVDDALTEAAR